MYGTECLNNKAVQMSGFSITFRTQHVIRKTTFVTLSRQSTTLVLNEKTTSNVSSKLPPHC